MSPFSKSVLTLFVLSFALLNSPFAQAQTFTGDLTLTTQAQVDAFNYTVVTGYLEVSGADIDDLSPLNGLTTIGDELNIHNNPILASINGFNNLSSLTNSMWITDNAILAEVKGFNALVNPGGAIYFYNHPKLVTVDAFHALESTGDNIDFWYNDVLATVSGFENLQTVGWSLEFGGNPKLVTIPDFRSLQTISSSLFIMENPILPAITQFQSLQYVDWSFTVLDNASVDSLCGFYNYFSANNPYTGGGTLTIQDNHPSMPSPTSIQYILDEGPCPDTGLPASVPTLGHWGLVLLIMMMGGLAWRFERRARTIV